MTDAIRHKEHKVDDQRHKCDDKNNLVVSPDGYGEKVQYSGAGKDPERDKA
jgi:hypothetical protein